MTLSKRAKVTETSTARMKSWYTPDRQQRVVEIKSKLGLSKRYLVCRRLENGNEVIVSRHRKKVRAIKTLEEK
jgi:hypothetical protein